MKKTLALILAAMLCLCAIPAMAEANDTLTIDLVENGAWVPFTDYNMQICLPSDWNVLQLTEEQTASGVIFSCANPESTRSFTLAYTEFEEATDLDTVAAQLAEAYTDVQMLTINDIPFVTYTVAENDVTGLATLGGSGIGMYQFVFYPASDADYGTLAVQIAASISAIE